MDYFNSLFLALGLGRLFRNRRGPEGDGMSKESDEEKEDFPP